jgi:hypothetical protein
MEAGQTGRYGVNSRSSGIGADGLHQQVVVWSPSRVLVDKL